MESGLGPGVTLHEYAVEGHYPLEYQARVIAFLDLQIPSVLAHTPRRVISFGSTK